MGVSKIQLSGLQYNGIGATVQTMIPLPGGPAISAGPSPDLSLCRLTAKENGVLPGGQEPGIPVPNGDGRL
jgi:hypothetical protein